MRNYMILNGKNSNEIKGLIIQEFAPITKPQMRTQVETIDGRDGDIVTPLGYAAYDKKITIGLYGNFDINEIIAYFATQGTAIFSNEPDKYYNYQILDQIDYERLVRYRVATVTMHVQPFKYSATEGTLTIDASDTVSGEGSEIALDNTAEAPFNVLRYKGNITQNGTPTPSAPVPVQAVTGRQTVEVRGKNLFNKDATLSENRRISTSNGNTYTSNGYTASDYTQVRPSTTYTLSAGITSYYSWYRADKTYISGGAWANGGQLTTPSDAYYVRFDFQTSNVDSVQLELGNQATAHEPTQKYEINLTGKNMLDASVGYRYGYIQSNGQYADNNIIVLFNGFIPVEPNTTYTFSSNHANWNMTAVLYADMNTFIDRNLKSGVAANTFTTPSNCHFVRLQVNYDNQAMTDEIVAGLELQLEKGGSASAYEAYHSIKLCKIGNHQDRIYKNLENGKWYLRKEISCELYDGTESGWRSDAGRIEFQDSSIMLGSSSDNAVVCDYYTTAWGAGTCIFISGTRRAVCILDSNNFAQNLDLFKAWIASHNLTIAYALAAPTDEEITDQDLIDALDEFYGQAHSYKGHTHIAATAEDGNAPAILSVEVGEDNESTVTNAGNTTSRPILTIYGQGDIGAYINDVEVLDIALGDEQYITLDSTEMDAYKDSPANLKNRLVTGDYIKLALNAGANKIRFTGKVTKYEISKYSRWL